MKEINENPTEVIKQVDACLKPNNFDEYLTRILNLLNERLDMLKSTDKENYKVDIVKQFEACKERLKVKIDENDDEMEKEDPFLKQVCNTFDGV